MHNKLIDKLFIALSKRNCISQTDLEYGLIATGLDVDSFMDVCDYLFTLAGLEDKIEEKPTPFGSVHVSYFHRNGVYIRMDLSIGQGSEFCIYFCEPVTSAIEI